MKLQKGWTYLVQSQVGYWYVIQQTGKRSWGAMVFSNCNVPLDEAFYSGNSMDLWSKLPKMIADRPYTHSAAMRKDMFSILKHGYVKDE